MKNWMLKNLHNMNSVHLPIQYDTVLESPGPHDSGCLQKLLMGRTWVPMEAEHHMHSYARFPTLHSTWTIISNYHIISCYFLWLISWYQLNILRIKDISFPPVWIISELSNSATGYSRWWQWRQWPGYLIPSGNDEHNYWTWMNMAHMPI